MEKDPVLQKLGYANYMEVCETFTRRISRFKLKIWRPYLKPEMQFLNLGCGGKILWPTVFKACDANIICFDKESDRFNSINAFLKKDGNEIDFTFQEQDFDWVQELPFQDKEIDLCVADFLFSELESDSCRDLLIMEMKRVSKRSVIINLNLENFRNYESENRYETAVCNFMSEIAYLTPYDQTINYFENRKETFSFEISYHDIRGDEINVTHAALIPHFLGGHIQETEVLDFLKQKNLVNKLPPERLQVIEF